jgi:hypothetical protein
MYQPESTFRYLGRQTTQGQDVDVVYFAQIPEKARMKQALNTDRRSLLILVQGLAWIDPASYQIVRMRTDVVFPQNDPDLKKETTESRFAAEHFSDDPHPVWLPVDVTVTVGWDGWTFCNRHRYADFKLFRVATSTRGPAQPPIPN